MDTRVWGWAGQSGLQAEMQEPWQTRRAHRDDGDGGKGPGKPHVNQLENEEQAKETG